MSSFSELMQSQTFQFRLKRVMQYTIAALTLFYAMFPVLWVISASIDPRNSLAAQQFIPPNANLDNYKDLLTTNIPIIEGDSKYDGLLPYLTWMWNSIKVSSIATIISVFITAMSAYAFSRFRFTGRRNLLLAVFLIQVFPAALTFVAVFLLFQAIGQVIPFLGLNSHAGLILFYLGGVLGINVWLMKGFLDTVPRDLDESAVIDGASHWQTFWYVILPLVRPIMAVIGMLTFIGTYNDFLIPQILLSETQQYTLAVGLIIFARQQFSQNWGVFAAGAVLGAIPIVVLYLFVQDYIVSGLTTGAVKG